MQQYNQGGTTTVEKTETAVSQMPTGTGKVTMQSSSTGVYPLGGRPIQITWFVIGLANVFLVLDFALRLLAANAVGFAAFVYAVGRVLAAPFDGIFSTTVTDGVYVFKTTDLLAILIYSLIGAGITRVIQISRTPKS